MIAAAIRNPLEVPRLRLHLASLGLNENAQIALGGQAAKPGSLNVSPLIDEDEKQRRKGMATAAIVTMFGLLFVLVIVANTPLAKREQASNQFRPEAQQSPLGYSQYQNDYSAPAYPYAAPTLPLAAPRISLPSAIPSYLLYPLPSYLLLPTRRRVDHRRAQRRFAQRDRAALSHDGGRPPTRQRHGVVNVAQRRADIEDPFDRHPPARRLRIVAYAATCGKPTGLA